MESNCLWGPGGETHGFPPLTFSIFARSFCRMVTIQRALHSSGLGEHFTYPERKRTMHRKFSKAFQNLNKIFLIISRIFPFILQKQIFL